MTVSPLLDHVGREAAAEAARRVADARAEAAARVDEARRQAERRRERAVVALEDAQAAERARRLAAVESESAGQVLASRRALVDVVLRRARERFAAVAGDPAYVAGLARWLERAVGFLPDGGVVLRAAPAAATAARVVAAARPGVTVHVDTDVPDGVVAESADGRVRVDGTWSRAVVRDRARLAIGILGAVAAPDAAP